MNFQGILDGIKNMIGGLFQPKQQQAQPQMPMPTPTPQPQQQTMGVQTPPKITEEQIRKGWEAYGGAPAASASATFADVANKYPVLQKYPGLLPAMSMKESSGGKANTKNWLNWGLYEDDYQEKDPNKVIESVARALGSDDSPSSHYYQKFRETGDIKDMLNRYAPPSENDTGLYHEQLIDWMKMFEQQ